MLLQVLVGFDESDPGARRFPTPADFVPESDVLDLKGKRIGVLRDYYGAGTLPDVEQIYIASIEILREAGAEIIDPVRIAVDRTLLESEFEMMKFEFKAGINAYLGEHDTPNNMATMADLIAFNSANAESVMPVFGQEVFMESNAMPGLTDPTYQVALDASVRLLRTRFTEAFAADALDLVIAPVNAPACKTDWVSGDRLQVNSSHLAAITGNPSVAVPAGYVSGLPVNIAFIGLPFSEPRLIQVAYVFEHAAEVWRPPRFLPTLETNSL
jgi:amidase